METNQSTYLTAVNIKVSKPSNQITEISIQNNSPITNNIIITPENDTKFSLPQKIETQKQIVEFLKYSSQRSNLLKTEFVNFLLKDENFLGMDESEKFLREKIIENINIINKNNLEITKKKEEYKKIILELNREINNNFTASHEEEEMNYRKKKEEIENEIKDKKHELGVMQNTYRKEYKERYLIIQKQKSEFHNIKINIKQFEKYNLLNKKISFEVNQKEVLLNDVKKYLEQSNKIFLEEIDNKAKIYKDLELEVQILKQSTESIEKSLNLVIDKRNKVCKLIDENIDINNFIRTGLENVSNEFFLNQIVLLKNTEMNNISLEDLMKKYNKIKNKMNGLKKELISTNNEITYLNEKLHKLNDEYEEKKIGNKKIKNQNKNKRDDKEFLTQRKEQKLVKEKINNLKNKNKECLFKSNSKTNFLILCLKFLFQSGNILYKSFLGSRIDFHFNLDQKDIYLNKIRNSKYYELINENQKYFFKLLTTNKKIFEEPKQLLFFCIKIFLFYISAINLMISNIFNICCFNDEDFIDKFPLSQFNSGIFSFKENDDNNIRESSKDVVINRESNKVIIQNFLCKDNQKKYLKHLNKNTSIIEKRNEIMGRTIEDIINLNRINYKTDTDNRTKKNYPSYIYFNFINNKDIPEQLKNSRYIKNHPSITLLSLKRFFPPEEQNSLFGIKSADLNIKRYNDDLFTRNKITQKSFDNNLTYLKSPMYKKKLVYGKNKNINDPYLSKEYMYEMEIEDYQEKDTRKKMHENTSKNIIKYSGQDPQKQIIFSRMLDLRNLELQSGNINNRSTSLNEINDEKINENKFYEMYDKFKKKYFFNHNKLKDRLKINSSDIGNKKSRKIIENNTKNKRNSRINNINMRKGIKFIRNNSDFFYGIKEKNNSLKSRYKKFDLPNINQNKDIINNNEKSKKVNL